jgi:hypothetical protein
MASLAIVNNLAFEQFMRDDNWQADSREALTLKIHWTAHYIKDNGKNPPAHLTTRQVKTASEACQITCLASAGDSCPEQATVDKISADSERKVSHSPVVKHLEFRITDALTDFGTAGVLNDPRRAKIANFAQIVFALLLPQCSVVRHLSFSETR